MHRKRRLVKVACSLIMLAWLLPRGATPAGAATGPTCGPTLTKPGGGAWICTFDDEFSGRSLDAAKWVTVTSANSGLAQGGACYVDGPGTISVSSGHLNLVARKVAPFVCADPYGSFASQYVTGQVATSGKFAQTYGRFAIRAKFPWQTVAGLQSALWMWPQSVSNTSSAGEIDIAEEYSAWPDRAIPYLHYAYDPASVDPGTNTNIVTNNTCLISNAAAFHEYAVEWSSEQITISYDGQVCLVDHAVASGGSPFDQPYFLVLTQALGIGSNAFVEGTTPLPATTEVDYVRIWK